MPGKHFQGALGTDHVCRDKGRKADKKKHKANTSRSKNYRFVKSSEHQQTRRGDLNFPLELLEDNVITVKEAFQTQATVVSITKPEKYKTDST